MNSCSGEFIWKEHFFGGDGDHLWNSNYAEKPGAEMGKKYTRRQAVLKRSLQ